MKLTILILSSLFILLFMIGCSVVTLPYKAGKTTYKATKTAVKATAKGAAAVGKVIVPGGSKDKK